MIQTHQPHTDKSTVECSPAFPTIIDIPVHGIQDGRLDFVQREGALELVEEAEGRGVGAPQAHLRERMHEGLVALPEDVRELGVAEGGVAPQGGLEGVARTLSDRHREVSLAPVHCPLALQGALRQQLGGRVAAGV